MGGGGVSAPRAICQTTGPILDPKMAFDSTGLELSEYVAKFYPTATDDVTGVKGQIFDFLSLLASPSKATAAN